MEKEKRNSESSNGRAKEETIPREIMLNGKAFP